MRPLASLIVAEGALSASCEQTALVRVQEFPPRASRTVLPNSESHLSLARLLSFSFSCGGKARDLKANDFKVTANVGPRVKFDFTAELNQTAWSVEVKYYRTKRPQPSLLEKTAFALQRAVSSYVTPDLRATLEEKYGILFVDRVDLSIWAGSAPQLLDPLATFLDEVPLEPSAKRRKLDESITLKAEPAVPAGVEVGASLCEELREVGHGKKYWKAYEILCEKILRYLFPNDLSGWHKQKRTEDGLSRYDLVCRLSPTTEFWGFVDSRLDTRYVLFEFKNYTGRIKQGQILTTEKYLLPLALRRFGIILSRKGADISAQSTVAGAMRESGKMMLVLDDDKVCSMLHAKDRGDDPSDLLFQYSDVFLMSLNR